ncbi:MAG: PH domain-containing protein [Telluria sp.]
MDQHPITLLFQTLFWIAAMAFSMRWLGRQRLRARPPGESRQIVQPPGILAIGCVGTAFGCAIWTGSVVWPDDTVGVWTHLVFGGLTLLGLTLVADFFFARHSVDDEGMHYGRMLGQRGHFRWLDVEQVSFNKRMNWYRLTLRSGVTVRVSGTTMGLPAFSAHVLRHVPSKRIDSAVRIQLESSARGDLPKPWK